MTKNKFYKKICYDLAIGGSLCGLLTQATAQENTKSQPNIIVILADDMGFSDLGCYGGEIETPNLDNLAATGIRFIQFYNTARCCPTRASLLTGLYQHQAGMGHMVAKPFPENPGYINNLNDNCVTIAQVLKTVGYFTIVTGKWHVGHKEMEDWPIQRGFDRFYGAPVSGGYYYHPKKGRPIAEGNEIIYEYGDKMPDGWYCTDAWTDHAIKYINEAIGEQKPFFLYLAHVAPHFDLQAPEEDIKKYIGKYKGGWDKVREDRYKKLIEMGIIDEKYPLPPPTEGNPVWDNLSEEKKIFQDSVMATYAAVIDHLDQSIGRLVDSLKTKNIFDNTLLIFLSDNGSCSQGGKMGSNKEAPPVGSPQSRVLIGKAWANASNTPFRYHKRMVHEGGIATPFIVHWPQQIDKNLHGTFNRQKGHVVDIMATCIDIAGANYPSVYNENKIVPLQGKSLLPYFNGSSITNHEELYFEHEGHRSIIKDDWKLVTHPNKKNYTHASVFPLQLFSLYNLQKDRTEVNDLSNEYPEKVLELANLWQEWAINADVVPKPGDIKKEAKDLYKNPSDKNLLGYSKGYTYKLYNVDQKDRLPDLRHQKAEISNVASSWNKITSKKADVNAIMIEGYFEAMEEGAYHFKINSENYSNLYIGDRLVALNDGIQENEVKIFLKQGVHNIRIDGIYSTSELSFELSYKTPEDKEYIDLTKNIYYKLESLTNAKTQ